MDDPLAVTMLVTRALEAAGAAYLIGGSLASGLYGLGRATMDADLVTPLQADQVQAFLRHLGPDFYADEQMILDAIETKRSFNLIHLPTMFKVDVFILGASPYAVQEFKRRRREVIDEATGRTAYFAAPEDVILTKLDWYKQSGSSERQWRDILGILKTQGKRLDLDYLRLWAKDLGLASELHRALAEAGME